MNLICFWLKDISAVKIFLKKPTVDQFQTTGLQQYLGYNKKCNLQNGW